MHSPFIRVHSLGPGEDPSGTRGQLLTWPVFLHDKPRDRCEHCHRPEHPQDDLITPVELCLAAGPYLVAYPGGYPEEDKVTARADNVDIVVNLESGFSRGQNMRTDENEQTLERSSMSSSA